MAPRQWPARPTRCMATATARVLAIWQTRSTFADVDSQFKRSGCDQDADFAVLQALLGVEAQFARERAVVRGDAVRAKLRREAFGEREGNLLHQAARVDEDQRGAVRAGVAGSESKTSSHIALVVTEPSSSDGISIARSSVRRWPTWMIVAEFAAGFCAGQECADQLDRVLRGGEADALRRRAAAGEKRAGREPVLAADQGVQPFERERQVSAALVVGDGVDFVDDDGADVAQMFPRLARGEQKVERLRRRDQDVRRVAQHAGALDGQRVAGADAGADGRAEIAACRASCWISASGPSRFFCTSFESAFSGET
jgi:hypothetical protein